MWLLGHDLTLCMLCHTWLGSWPTLETHWEAVKHVIRYLKGTKDVKLILGKGSTLTWEELDYKDPSRMQGYSNADGNSEEHCHAILGYVFCILRSRSLFHSPRRRIGVWITETSSGWSPESDQRDRRKQRQPDRQKTQDGTQGMVYCHNNYSREDTYNIMQCFLIRDLCYIY